MNFFTTGAAQNYKLRNLLYFLIGLNVALGIVEALRGLPAGFCRRCLCFAKVPVNARLSR
jgi:hypothetical protein